VGAILSQAPGSHSNNVRSYARLDGDAVAKRNNSAGIGGDALTGNDNAGEIQGIRRRDSNDLAAPIKLTPAETLPHPPSAPIRPCGRQSSAPLLSLIKRLEAVLRLYWQDVWRSLVHDWRNFLTIPSRQKQGNFSRLRTKIVIPITNWLRQPLTTNRAQSEPPSMARPAQKT
jgi:hypothetical protein